MRFKKWNIGTPAERDVALLRSAGYPYLLSTVLAARGVTTAEAAAEALERDRSLSMSPMLMRDMDKAVARIQRAISQGETIAVFGDYDVDGITSTVLLMDYLKSCGVRCLRHIPRRIEEGYGLSKEAIQGLRDQGATLMITVDCGITGNEEVDFAASIGLDVVITDHHECKEELPRALAVVDPHRSDCPYPFKHLAGVGVALKLVLALGGESREDALFARYCTLAAIGTIADVMRMEGENRTIAFCGLEALPHTDFVGVHALLKGAGLLGKPITSVQIGFVLAPRINAAGRMGAADLAADLLETDDPARAEELAKALCDLNRERQAVEQAICADATEKIERLRAEDRSALVLSSEDWHQGVVGIVASRLIETKLHDSSERRRGQGFLPVLRRVQPVFRAGVLRRPAGGLRRPRVGGGLYHLRGEHRRLPGPDEPVCPLRLRRGTGGILPGRGRAHLLPRRGDAGGGGAAGPAGALWRG